MRLGREPWDGKGHAHWNPRKPGHRIAALFGVRIPGDNSCGRGIEGEKKSPGKGRDKIGRKSMITAGELRLSLGEGAMLPEKLSLFASANEHAFLRAEGILSGSSGGVGELPGSGSG